MHREILQGKCNKMVKQAGIILLLLLLAGCSATPVHFSSQPESLKNCLDEVVWLDQLVTRNGIRDYQSSQVAGFPFLRSNRFLASYAEQPLQGDHLRQWLMALQQLDVAAREYEFNNLPETAKTQLNNRYSDAIHYFRGCSEQSLLILQRDPQAIDKLRERVAVVDNYRSSLRWMGLYPLTSLYVEGRIADYQQQVKARFAEPLERLHSPMLLQRYQSVSTSALSPDQLNKVLDRAHDNPLTIPLPDSADSAALFNHFAPMWEIEVKDQNDLIGSPYWREQEIAVDTTQPMVYHYLSHTRFNDEVLLQLNYVVWFAARPSSGSWDIYAGELDGITWRVTLDRDGEVLLYDSMHNCGCYHKLYPGERLLVRDEAEQWREPALIPQNAPELNDDQRIVVRISSSAHYIERIYPDQLSGMNINMGDYHQLRSLPMESGERRSLFGKEGLIAQSARPERWLLWPMGVPSAGAMRQAGNHPIAFVGRRHFDEVDLLETIFERQAPLQTE